MITDMPIPQTFNISAITVQGSYWSTQVFADEQKAIDVLRKRIAAGLDASNTWDDPVLDAAIVSAGTTYTIRARYSTDTGLLTRYTDTGRVWSTDVVTL